MSMPLVVSMYLEITKPSRDLYEIPPIDCYSEVLSVLGVTLINAYIFVFSACQQPQLALTFKQTQTV